MRRLFAALLVLLIAVAIALAAREDPGHVVVRYHGWTFEASLVFVTIAALLAGILLYYLIRILVTTCRLPRRLREWRQRRAERRARRALVRGCLDLCEGRWAQAEKRLIRGAGSGDTAVLGYLAAARAAHQQGAWERRDRHLRQALKCMPNAGVAVGLTRAELLAAQGRYEEALATLGRLRRGSPRNGRVLGQLRDLYIGLHDWERLLEILPALRKSRVVDREEAQRLEIQAYEGLLERALGDRRALGEIWRRIPASFKSSETLVREYVRGLIGCDAAAEAEAVLRGYLARRWSDGAAYLYGLVEGDDPARQLRRAEAWLAGREDNPVLLLTLGRLCKRNGLWGKARHYLEASLARAATPETCHELADTLERMGEPEEAVRYYRQGLAAVAEDLHRRAVQPRAVPALLSTP